MAHDTQNQENEANFYTGRDEQPLHQGGEATPILPPPALHAPLAQERDYLEALRVMEQGQWERAVPMLHALQVRHPSMSDVAELLQEATFRASMESQWAAQVTDRQAFRLPVRVLTPTLVLLFFGILLLSGVIYYGRVERVNALIDQQAALLQQAQAALAGGQHREALDLFEQLLTANPTNLDARKGAQEARRQLQLATDYQVALDHIAAGNYQQALALLINLQTAAPGYRDVDKQIAEVKTGMSAPRVFADAELAFANGLWITAIAHYEQLRRLDNDYEAAVTQEHLAIAYLRAGQQMVALRPSDSMAPAQAQGYLQKALQLQPAVPALKTETQLLSAYQEGERLVKQQSYESAIQTLFPIYETRPTYFGGYVAELLAQAYVGMAERYVADHNLENALVVYERAVQLGLDRGGLMEQRLTAIKLLLAPPPTPTLTPAPVIFAPPPVAPAPMIEATPTVDWRDQYRGWIAFRSLRNGGEAIYIMRADGSEVQPAPPAVTANLTQLYQQQQVTADGSQTVYVKQTADQSGANIFTATTGNDERMVTGFPGTEYDPVWSPDGQWIAFVANHTGNDEIWRMDLQGGQQGQLTFNDWQWDKHPSFSPDGQQLVFYSNRTGLRQIWRMAADGANQQNLSNNTFEEWDPVWIR